MQVLVSSVGGGLENHYRCAGAPYTTPCAQTFLSDLSTQLFLKLHLEFQLLLPFVTLECDTLKISPRHPFDKVGP